METLSVTQATSQSLWTIGQWIEAFRFALKSDQPQLLQQFNPQAAPQVAKTSHSAVLEDIRLLGALLGMVLKLQPPHHAHGQRLFMFVEGVRQQASDTTVEGLHQWLVAELSELGDDVQRLQWVQHACDAFRVFLTLANVAEEYHSCQQAAEAEQIPLVNGPPQHWPWVRVVATAHPTEISRRLYLQHSRSIFMLLDELHQQTHWLGQAQVLERIQEAIARLLATRFSRWQKPSVQDEIKQVLVYFEQIYPLLATLDTTSPNTASTKAIAPIALGSWVGGDMDGNPNVVPEVFSFALLQQHLSVLDQHGKACLAMAFQTSHAASWVPASETLKHSIAQDFTQYFTCHAPDDNLRAMIDQEPHRLKLILMARRLEHTRLCRVEQNNLEPFTIDNMFVYTSWTQYWQDVAMVIDSLKAGGSPYAAKALEPLQRQAQLFGFRFASVDLREDTQWLHQALKEVHPELANTDKSAVYDWFNLKKQKSEIFLKQNVSAELAPCYTRLTGMLRVAAQANAVLDSASCVQWVLSMTTHAADFLCAQWLCEQAELTQLQIVPLFETIEALHAAPDILETLLQNPLYQRHLKALDHCQVIMLGYSDSNKDGGYTSSQWLLYQAQVKLLAVAKHYQIKLQFFHGRGGNIGRGGGPAHRAIQALPKGSTQFGQQLTEQGEVLSRLYNVPSIAARHLQRLCASTVAKAMADETQADVPVAWEEAVGALSNYAQGVYRLWVHQHPHFVDFFNDFTVRETELIPMGSRPARRKRADARPPGVNELRAIPWVFRWFQSRLILPAWFGLGSALAQFEDVDLLKTMAQDWPFFNSMLENARIGLRQSDLSVARFAFDQLITPENKAACEPIFEALCQEYALTVHWINTLLPETPSAAAVVRPEQYKKPYLNVLSVLQLWLVANGRKAAEQDSPHLALFQEAIISSTGGLATGLGTTG